MIFNNFSSDKNKTENNANIGMVWANKNSYWNFQCSNFRCCFQITMSKIAHLLELFHLILILISLNSFPSKQPLSPLNVGWRKNSLEASTVDENLARMRKKLLIFLCFPPFVDYITCSHNMWAGILKMTEIFMPYMRLQITMWSSHSFWWESFYAGVYDG